MSEVTRADNASAADSREASEQMLGAILMALPELARHHARGSKAYKVLDIAARQSVAALFAPGQARSVPFGPFGKIVFPYRSMGAVNSLDLFGLDELIIFSFYWANRNRYRKVADIGANIGLHSLVMARCGFEVTSFEPDPRHIDMLNENMHANGVESVKLVSAAVSDKIGRATFIRVVGNTTGSHLAGAKSNPYGELDKFDVSLVPFTDIIAQVDFAKVDAEGHEVVILTSVRPEQWDGVDVMVEIGTEENAKLIFDYAAGAGVNIFTQKTGWARAASIADLPTSYKEGSAFLTRKSTMPGLG